MTEIEIEKQAEEYVINTVCKTECPVWNIHSGCTIPRKDCNYTSNRLKGYIDGAKWGMEHQWHDLRKNPNDLPKEEKEVLVYMWDSYYIGSYSSEDVEWWFNEFSLDYKRLDEIIAWCELPQFKDKE